VQAAALRQSKILSSENRAANTHESGIFPP
jgi:hypothetical protein